MFSSLLTLFSFLVLFFFFVRACVRERERERERERLLDSRLETKVLDNDSHHTDLNGYKYGIQNKWTEGVKLIPSDG